MNSKLWYREPASEWLTGLPIGNGVLGGMVMGTVPHERIALNHEWLWRGQYRDRDIDSGDRRLDEIRELFLAGKPFEAGTLANEMLGGRQGQGVDSYQPLGDLRLEIPCAHVSDYRRELDLERALVVVSYRADGGLVRREILAHSVWPVIAVHLLAPEGTPFQVAASLSRIDDPYCDVRPVADERGFGLVGAFASGVSFALWANLGYADSKLVSPLGEGVGLGLEECRDAILLLSATVTLNGEDPLSRCREQFANVPTDWAELLNAHTAEHQRRYNRVTLDLGSRRDDLPTDERLARLRAGEDDEGLLALYFNFGRYLLIASSLGATLPAHLQGIWNEELNPAFGSDFHHDVNLQMNYWPAEVCNLAECTEPLFAYLERFVPHGRVAARRLYGCAGIVLPITADPWVRATPVAHGWDVWTGAAAWLAQHMWWRYEYGLDQAFLEKRAYPFFKEVAAFYQSYLVRDPQGKLVTVPSQSPENRFVGGTEPVSLCVAATMDLELICDVLTHVIKASEILGVDEQMREQWRQILADIPALQIGKWGQLQEWLEDYDEVEPGHRHLSHLFALFPGDQIALEDTPVLAEAARISLERRLTYGAKDWGWHDLGWTQAWLTCCLARLRDGDAAREHLRGLVGELSADSLFHFDTPHQYQIDGNFGGTAGLAEMLLQSHRGLIRVLPALPAAWPHGQVTGLCARGGFEVDIEWSENQPQRVVVRSRCGQECRLAGPEGLAVSVTEEEQPIVVQRELGAFTWPTQAGHIYEVSFRVE